MAEPMDVTCANNAESAAAAAVAARDSHEQQQQGNNAFAGLLALSLMFERVMLASSSDLLGFLSIEDILRVGATSKFHWQCVCNEIHMRAFQLATDVSLSWNAEDEDGRQVSADDLPYVTALQTRYHDELQLQWWQHAAPNSRVEMLGIIAQWAGGWPRLLHARENGAQRPPRLVADGSTIRIATLGRNVLPLVFFFDMYCDDKWKWSGLLPLTDIERGAVIFPGEEEDTHGFYVYPYSSKSLGLETDTATVHDFNHGHRPRKYLLSTKADDTRKWTFNVSFLSQHCSETLVMSHDIIPAAAVASITANNDWHPNNFGPSDGAFDPNLKRAGSYSVTPSHDIIGIDSSTGMTKVLELIGFEIGYWHDKRDPKSHMLHLTVDFSGPDSMFEEMIVNPPPPASTNNAFDSNRMNA